MIWTKGTERTKGYCDYEDRWWNDDSCLSSIVDLTGATGCKITQSMKKYIVEIQVSNNTLVSNGWHFCKKARRIDDWDYSPHVAVPFLYVGAIFQEPSRFRDIRIYWLIDEKYFESRLLKSIIAFLLLRRQSRKCFCST